MIERLIPIEVRPAEASLSGDLTVVMPVRGQDPAAALVAPPA
jgi:hypothetical protein